MAKASELHNERGSTNLNMCSAYTVSFMDRTDTELQRCAPTHSRLFAQHTLRSLAVIAASLAAELVDEVILILY
jgi:hypothetical protein